MQFGYNTKLIVCLQRVVYTLQSSGATTWPANTTTTFRNQSAGICNPQFVSFRILCVVSVLTVQVWLPVLLGLVKEAANAVQPAAAAAFGENDPRFYVKVSTLRCTGDLLCPMFPEPDGTGHSHMSLRITVAISNQQTELEGCVRYRRSSGWLMWVPQVIAVSSRA
jgi:hypothetical protein